MDSLAELFDKEKLDNFKKADLIDIILALQKEKHEIILQQTKVEAYDERITELERSHQLYMQYGRRESIEITGIPSEFNQDQLEDEVIKIYHEAQVEVHGREINHFDIAACHRIGKRGVTIVRFVNRKFALAGLFNGKNMKGTKLYGDKSIYINNSFCNEYQYIGYVIRNLKKRSMINGYRIKNGVYFIKVGDSDSFEVISHKNDFNKHNLDIESALSA